MHPILQPEVTKLGVTRNPSVFSVVYYVTKLEICKHYYRILTHVFHKFTINYSSVGTLNLTSCRLQYIESVELWVCYLKLPTTWEAPYGRGYTSPEPPGYLRDPWYFTQPTSEGIGLCIKACQLFVQLWIYQLMSVQLNDFNQGWSNPCLITNFIVWYRPKSPFFTTGTTIYCVNQLQID